MPDCHFIKQQRGTGQYWGCATCGASGAAKPLDEILRDGPEECRERVYAFGSDNDLHLEPADPVDDSNAPNDDAPVIGEEPTELEDGTEDDEE